MKIDNNLLLLKVLIAQVPSIYFDMRGIKV